MDDPIDELCRLFSVSINFLVLKLSILKKKFSLQEGDDPYSSVGD